MTIVTIGDQIGEFLTVAETANLLRCSEPTVRRRIRAGEIPAVKLGEGRSAIRIDAGELAYWLYQRRTTHDATRGGTPGPHRSSDA
jgi:excisionase family DNA binding protein